MAWMPGATRKEISKHRTPLTNKRGFCLHVAVSEASSLYGFFSGAAVCSHFYIRKDGTIEQYVSTAYRAPANLDGNSSLISVETQGGVTKADSEPWTAAQAESLAKIAAWLNKTHGIPLQLMPNSRPEHRGICYHRQGVDPYRVSGGQRWSNAYGKICPGQGKINQIPGIITRAKQIAGGDVPPPPPKDWFDLATKNELKEALVELIPEIADKVWDYRIARFNGDNKVRAQTLLSWSYRDGQKSLPGNTASAVWDYRAPSYISGNENTMSHALRYTQESANRLRQTDIVGRPGGGDSSYAYATSQVWKLLVKVAEAQADGRALTKAEIRELTTAVVEAIPEDLATDVADEMGARLAPGDNEGTAA